MVSMACVLHKVAHADMCRGQGALAAHRVNGGTLSYQLLSSTCPAYMLISVHAGHLVPTNYPFSRPVQH